VCGELQSAFIDKVIGARENASAHGRFFPSGGRNVLVADSTWPCASMAYKNTAVKRAFLADDDDLRT
jgi:hypothetical protein